MKAALRRLLREPTFCIAAVLTLALGVGVNATAFSVLNRLLLQSLPYRDPDRLVQIWSTVLPQGWQQMAHAPGDYLEERKSATVFSNFAAYNPNAQTSLVEAGKVPIQVTAVHVTANFFPTLGVEPRLGRLFTEAEDTQRQPLALISSSFWESHYGSTPKILGRTVNFQGTLYTIIGVMPPALDDPLLFNGNQPGFWVLDGIGVNANLHGHGWYTEAARLKDGVDLKQAQAELDVIAHRLAAAYPVTNRNVGLMVTRFPVNNYGQYVANLTWMVMALSSLVLVIACLNLANLQLVRTTRRTGEIAVRLALGCPRWRIAGILMGESLLLSLAGGLLALVVARWSNIAVEQFLKFDLPVNFRVLGFTLLVSAIAGLAFGILPGWLAAKTDLQTAIKAGGRTSSSGRSRRWFRHSLVVVEISLAVVILAGAGYFVIGIYHLGHQQMGWKCDNGVIGFLSLDHEHFGERRDPRSLAFSERLLERLKALPGVNQASLGLTSPATYMPYDAFQAGDQPAPAPGHEMYAADGIVSPEFLDMFGVRLLQGRNFRASDRTGSPPVVLVSEALAKQLWPGKNALGRRFGVTSNGATEWSEVIGVISNFRMAGEPPDQEWFNWKFLRPWAQNSHRFIGFCVRTNGNAAAEKETMRKTLALLAPDMAPSRLQTFEEVQTDQISLMTFVQQALLELSGLGLLLAVIGLYGVVANLAAERTREIGIRLALGAQRSSIGWFFLKGGVIVAAVGVVFGAAAAVALLRILRRSVPFPNGGDATVIAIVATVLFLSAIIASWVPAFRATTVNPVDALRAE